ncbi:MAG: hypothetical protein K6G00_05360 [Treponema sp.]|nr:hypothetical protein [Treponema sp.]
MKTQKTVGKLFNDKSIRCEWDEEEQDWYYCVTDVVTFFKDNSDTDDYIKKLRKRDTSLSKVWEDLIVLLPVQTAGGVQKAKFANTANMLRILFSVNSEKANAFKMWLAQNAAKMVYENTAPTMAGVFKEFSMQKVSQRAKAQAKLREKAAAAKEKLEKAKSEAKAKPSSKTKTAAKSKTSAKTTAKKTAAKKTAAKKTAKN